MSKMRSLFPLLFNNHTLITRTKFMLDCGRQMSVEIKRKHAMLGYVSDLGWE